MATLSPTGQDRLFMLGLGITACLAVGLMRRVLVKYRDAAVLPHIESKPQYITQDVEDSLKLSTLDKLLDSPNYSIQETTSIIICERALHDESTINVLLWHITQPDHALREQGIRALNMMVNSSTVAVINKPSTWAALVEALAFSVKDYKHNAYDPEWDNWHLRDVVEQGCLLVLSQLVEKFGVEGLIKTRFVERWLAKEPWGKDELERQTNFEQSLGRQLRLNDLNLPLCEDRAARRQLRKVGLLPGSATGTSDSGFSDTTDVKMIGGESTSGEDFENMFVDNRRRRDQSSEEDNIRRRNREAMVLNDGTRPLERGDIIQRER